MNKIIYFFIIFIINFFYIENANSSENKIIFKINEKAFTSFDYEERLEYLKFVGNNANLEKNIVLDDFISANIFFEYYQKSNDINKLEKKINEIYENIKNTNNLNNNKVIDSIDKKEILRNIKIDYVRKIILENILNSNFNKENLDKEELDLIYNFRIQYLNFEISKKNNHIKKNLLNLKNININKVENLLISNKINFFYKDKEVDDIKKLDKKILDTIKSNKNNLLFIKDSKYSFIFIEKSFETYKGINASLYSLRSNKEISQDILKCDNLKEMEANGNGNIIIKNYKFENLNNKLKENLLNINDYVKLNDGSGIAYIILCNITFDKKILGDLNLNKLVNSNVIDIEKKFIKKYSKIYNLIIK